MKTLTALALALLGASSCLASSLPKLPLHKNLLLVRGGGSPTSDFSAGSSLSKRDPVLRGGGGDVVLSSIPASIFNLIKNIVGAGVLTLPSGLAAFSDVPSVSLAPALMVTLCLGALSGYCFHTIGEVCAETDEPSYSGAFEKTTHLPGKIVDTVITCKTGIAALCYSIIIGDLARDLVSSFGVEGIFSKRSNLLIGLTVAVLLPLCLLRSLAALAPFSLLGVIGTLAATAFMGLRFFGGDYAAGGKFFDAVAKPPVFGKSGTSFLPAFVLVSQLSSAFIAHFNAARFKAELKDPTTARFGTVVAAGFGGAAFLCMAIMSFGALTFGASAEGLVLNNYATSDPLAGVARIGIFLSVLFSYPLAFSALRNGLVSLLNISPTPMQMDGLTVFLLTGVTLAALVFSDLGFVVAFGGAVLASLVAYILPAMMHLGLNGPAVKDGSATPSQRNLVVVNRAIIVTGVLLGALGASVSVLKTFTDVLG